MRNHCPSGAKNRFGNDEWISIKYIPHIIKGFAYPSETGLSNGLLTQTRFFFFFYKALSSVFL